MLWSAARKLETAHLRAGQEAARALIHLVFVSHRFPLLHDLLNFRCPVLLIATSTPTGFIYLAAMLITDFANLVNFLSVSDSSFKAV